MASTVDQIKDRLSIVDVISSYIKLSKAGKDFKGISPFTKEKTPSFFVSPDRGVYYCFSTNKGGDMFTFIEEMEHVDFRGALKILAERAGVEIVQEKPGERDQKEKLYQALEEATIFYQKKLSEHIEARAYLEKRGISEKTIKDFRIGYAPPPEKDGWKPLTSYLEARGFKKHELVEAGLTKVGERGDSYDQFRGRVVFPMFDAAGRPVAFSGRLFPDDSERSKKAPKYLNSPDTPLYHKSKFLYGYDRVRMHARKFNFCMLVEGQMDLVLSHQAGYPNTAAVSGTALTEDHLQLLKRLSDNILLAFDEDPAGIRAGLKSAGTALSLGMEVKVASMPLGKDPADVVREDPELLKKAIKESTHVVPFALHVFKRGSKDQRAYAKRVYLEVLPLVAKIPNAIDRAGFVRTISETLQVREDSVWEALNEIQQKNAPEQAVAPKTISDLEQRKKSNPLCLIHAKISLLKQEGNTAEADTLELEAKKIAGDGAWEIISRMCTGETMIGEQFSLERHPRSSQEVLARFERQVLEKKSAQLKNRISEAEKTRDEASLNQLLIDQQQISKRLHEIR